MDGSDDDEEESVDEVHLFILILWKIIIQDLENYLSYFVNLTCWLYFYHSSYFP